MKIAVIGSGAIGCLYGAYLSKQNEVHMLCRRPSVAQAIERDGLTVFEPDGSVGRYSDVHACVSGECDTTADLVLIIVKGGDTDAAITENLGIIGEHTMVMTLQNGGGNDLAISRFVPMERVIVATTRHNSVNLDNGNIRHSGSGTTYIGSNVAGVDLSAIAKTFEDAGIETVVSDDIQRIIWSKLFVNLSINAFTAITKAPIGSMIEGAHAWDFAEKLVCEAIDVAAAEGQSFSYLEVLSSLHDTCEAVSGGFSSMSQDVMNCRKTEIDAINGYVVARAAAHNVPAPYNTFVCNLVHAIEDTYKEQTKELVKYGPGQVILEEGEVASRIFKVMHGKVMMTMGRGQPDEYLIGAYGEGTCFGEYSCLAGEPNFYSAVAYDDVIVMEVPKAEVHNFVALNPKNAMDMLTMQADQIKLMAKHIALVNEELTLGGDATG